MSGFYGSPPAGGVATDTALDGFYGESSLGPPINSLVVRAEEAAISAEASEVAAQASADSAGASASAAQASETASQISANASSASASASEASRVSANASEVNADASELLAQQWATNPEDVVVTGGQYSSFHWAQKAEDAVTSKVSSVSGTAPIVSSGGITPAISITPATTGAAGSMSASDKTKLNGIASGAQVNVPTNLSLGTITATKIPVNSSTGTDISLPVATTSLAGLQSAADKTKLDGVATGANNYVHPASHPPSIITQDASNRFFTDTERTKLTSIATGATANSSDATLLARANHTGTQAASTISDFNSASRAQTEAELVAGANVTITPSGTGATRQLTIASTSSGLGDVVGPASSTNNFPALFNGVTGKLLKQGTAAIGTAAYATLTTSATDTTAGRMLAVGAQKAQLGSDVAGTDSPAFTGTPTVPTAAPGTNTTQAASTAFVLANQSGLGIGQTWQNVSGSRALGTTYTNSTGRPIQVIVTIGNSTVSTTFTVTVGGVAVCTLTETSTAAKPRMQITAIVPNGSTYSATSTGPALALWTELR